MANRFLKYSLSTLENAPLSVGKFYNPVDFIGLRFGRRYSNPHYFGYDFYVLQYLLLIVNVGDNTVTFKLINAIKSPMLEHTC